MQTRAEKWQQLVDLLDQADALQQELLADAALAPSYEFHTQLNNIADELTDFANAEGVDIV